MRSPRIVYSEREMAWLEANRTLIISDYHRAFVAEFDRGDVSAAHLHGLRKRKGWKVGREAGRYKGRRLRYSDEEIAWLCEHQQLAITDYHAGFCQAFGRQDVTAAKLHSLRKREGFKTGRTGQFAKGSAPANKGKKCPPGTMGNHPNAQRTQFQKGQVSHTFKGAGHEYIDSQGGYVVLIVDEPNPWTGAETRPVHKHRWLWEKAHGPIPDDHVLKCLDGNKTNCDPSNWELIPRGVLPHLSARFGMHFDQAEAELKPTIMAVARLKHAVKKARSGKDRSPSPTEREARCK